MRVFFGGINSEMRVQIWPYLLRVVDWNDELEEGLLDQFAASYEQDVDNNYNQCGWSK